MEEKSGAEIVLAWGETWFAPRRRASRRADCTGEYTVRGSAQTVISVGLLWKPEHRGSPLCGTQNKLLNQGRVAPISGPPLPGTLVLRTARASGCKSISSGEREERLQPCPSCGVRGAVDSEPE